MAPAPSPRLRRQPRVGASARHYGASAPACIVYGVIGLVLRDPGPARDALRRQSDRRAGGADVGAGRDHHRDARRDLGVLTDAGATARSFAGTLERTPSTIQSAADTIGSVQAQLDSVSSQLGLFSILGANPLSGVATVFGPSPDGLDGLDTAAISGRRRPRRQPRQAADERGVARRARATARVGRRRTARGRASRTASPMSSCIATLLAFIFVDLDRRAGGRSAVPGFVATPGIGADAA